MNGVAAAFNPTNHLFDSGITNLPRGLFQGRDPDPCQFGPFQLIEPQQTNIAAPVEANALQ